MGPNVNLTWTVWPHGPLETLEANLWRVQGDLPGMPLKRVMTVARASDGRLVVHNPIGLDEATLRALEALGQPGWLVVPNRWHRLDAKPFAERYPDARVYAPSGARANVAEVVPVHGSYADFPGDRDISLTELEGTAGREGTMTVRSGARASRVFNDVFFNMPHVPGAKGFVLRHVTGSTGGLRVSRVASLTLLKEKAAFRAHVESLATPDVVRLIVSHHEMVTVSPSDALRAAVARF